MVSEISASIGKVRVDVGSFCDAGGCSRAVSLDAMSVQVDCETLSNNTFTCLHENISKVPSQLTLRAWNHSLAAPSVTTW